MDAEAPSEAPECDECHAAFAKYRCPRCMHRTCSLPCCTAHKERLGCNGERDKTQFVSMGAFSEANLQSDYFFLNGGVDMQGAAKRQLEKELSLTSGGARKRRRQGPAPASPASRLSPAVESLVRHARERGVDLRVMPQAMERRQRNSSRWLNASNRMLWRVEFSFAMPDGAPPVVVADDSVDEASTLLQRLEALLAPRETAAAAARLHQLRDYVAAGAGALFCAMKRELQPANAPLYHALDARRTLRELLVNKIVLEYPTVVVDLPARAGDYARVPPAIEVLSSDSEDSGDDSSPGARSPPPPPPPAAVQGRPPADEEAVAEDAEMDVAPEVLAAAKAELFAAVGLQLEEGEAMEQ